MLIAGMFIPLWIIIPIAVLAVVTILNLFMLLLAPIIGLKILFKIVKLVFKILKILFPVIIVVLVFYLIYGALF